ncbi:hypothetical protein ACFE04_001797 [Oxalis oulophora]
MALSNIFPSNFPCTNLSPVFKSSTARKSTVLARNSRAQQQLSSVGGLSLKQENKSFPAPFLSLRKQEADVVIIGSKWHWRLVLCRAVTSFNSGPSLYSGLQSRGLQANPLAQVLDALDEPHFRAPNMTPGWFTFLKLNSCHGLDLEKYASQNAVQEWKKLLEAILPLPAAAMALPPLSIRGDFGVLSTAAARYAPGLLKSFIEMGSQGAFGATKLLRPFSDIVDSLELKEGPFYPELDRPSFFPACRGEI